MDEEKLGGYYAVIPATILYDSELTANEKMLYAIISQLAIKTGFCYASNSYLAERLGITPRAVSKWINKLIQKNYVRYEYEYEPGTREIKERHLYIGIEQPFHTYRTDVLGGIEQPFHVNNINEHNKEILSKDSTKKVFQKPTLDDVKAYCQERNSPVNPDTFYDYYEAGDWKDSQGNKVKNWKQKLITWEKKNYQKSTPPTFTLGRKEKKLSAEDEEILRRLHED